MILMSTGGLVQRLLDLLTFSAKSSTSTSNIRTATPKEHRYFGSILSYTHSCNQLDWMAVENGRHDELSCKSRYYLHTGLGRWDFDRVKMKALVAPYLCVTRM